MASGGYMPVPVREVLINKEEGRKRALGIPTVLDRVAQEVILQELEVIVKPYFSDNLFGYRPMKSQPMAVKQCLGNCQKFNWAIDLDIKGFFDERIQKLSEVQRGWVNNFRVANMQGKLLELDGWIRNRLMYCIWHHWNRAERVHEYHIKQL